MSIRIPKRRRTTRKRSHNKDVEVAQWRKISERYYARKDVVQKTIMEDIAPFLIDKYGIQACLSCSLITANALTHYGIPAEPRICRVTFANEEWVKWVNEHGLDEWVNILNKGEAPDELWTIGIGYEGSKETAPDEGEAFHAVVFLPVDDEIVDMTAGQASRPEKNLIIEPYWITEHKMRTRGWTEELPMIHFEWVKKNARKYPSVAYRRGDIKESMNTVLGMLAYGLGVTPAVMKDDGDE